jgi:hypothetical protein
VEDFHRCCNPYKQPGKYGNAACSGGATAKCCTNGDWSCPLSDGSAVCKGIRTCGPFGSVCEVKCCDPFKEPIQDCLFGYKCCYNGQWSCVDPFAGTYSCGGSSIPISVASAKCTTKCCPGAEKPTADDCIFGVKCCYTGKWACSDPFQNYECNGIMTSGPFSSQC